MNKIGERHRLFPAAGRRVSGAEILLTCPDCGREKLYFNTDKNVGWCHYCAKPVIGDEELRKLFYGSDSVFDFLAPTQRRKGSGPMTYTLSSVLLHNTPKEYLKTRGIDPESLRQAPVFWDNEEGRLVVALSPLTPEAPPAVMTRTIRPDLSAGKWLAQAGIKRSDYAIGALQVPHNQDYIIVVEGAFDVLRHLQGHAMAICGTNLSDTHLAYLSNYDRVYFWLDPDEAGTAGTQKAMIRCAEWGIHAENLYDLLPLTNEPGDASAAEAALVLGAVIRD